MEREVGNPLAQLTSGRSDRLVTLLKRLGPRDSHNQGCRYPRLLTSVGSVQDWSGKDCGWAEEWGKGYYLVPLNSGGLVTAH